jgi:hypothetical protein
VAKSFVDFFGHPSKTRVRKFIGQKKMGVPVTRKKNVPGKRFLMLEFFGLSFFVPPLLGRCLTPELVLGGTLGF